MKRAVDRFDLKLYDVAWGEWECWNGMLSVDGEPVLSPEDYSIDWGQLVRALVEPGQYVLFTCTCGHAGCAGLEQHNIVTHHDTFYRWEMHQPSPKSVLEFDREDAFRQTLELLEEVRSFVPRADYEDYPLLPVGYRDASLDWCLKTLRTRKAEGNWWDNRTRPDQIPGVERELYYLQLETDRPLPSERWIRRNRDRGF